MKLTFPRALPAMVLSLAACLALASCPNPMLSVAGEDGGEAASGDGLVRFRFSMQDDFPASKAAPGGISRTVWPNDDSIFFLINYYRVRAVGPRQAYVDRTIYTASKEISVDGFMPGSWQIAVEACNHNDTVVAAASTYISIGSGELPSVSLALVSRLDPNQDGNLWIDISLPVALIDPVLSGSLTRLKPAGGSAEDLSPWLLLSTTSSGCHTPQRSCPAGAYRLDLALAATVNSVPGVRVWGVSEILYVVQGQTSCYRATLTTNELMAGPYDPYISLSSGVVVESGGVGTGVEVYCDMNAVNIYTLDGSAPAYDRSQRSATHGTVCGSYAALELGSALDADSDGVITVTVQSFNDWGQSAQYQRVYYLSDAIYVDSSDSGSALRGTPRDPFTTIATASSRILDLGRQAMTDIRAARGLYNELLTVRTGTALSGSYAHVTGTDSWTRDAAALSDASTYDDANATVIAGNPIYDTGSESAPYATVSVTPGLSMEARLEYLSIEGPQAGAGYSGCYLAALSASYIYDNALVLDHLRLRGNAQAANMSFGLQAYYAYDLRTQACAITGRETAGASGLHSIGVDLNCSGLTDSGSTISSGSANISGWAYGIRVPWADANSFISLSNSKVSGNGSASPVSATLGINSYGASDLTVGPGCKIDSGLGDYAIAIKTYDCDLEVRGSQVTASGTAGSGGSYGIFCSLSSSNTGNTVTISGNSMISAGESDTGVSTGLHIDTANLISTILIEGNKISGGEAPLANSLNGFTFAESGASTGTLVLRNNIIYRGNGSANGTGASIIQQQPTGSVFVLLANNDFISTSYMTSSPALFLGGYIQPYIINNIFVAGHGSDYCILHTPTTASAYALLNNEFYALNAFNAYADTALSPVLPNSLPGGSGNLALGFGASLFADAYAGNGGTPVTLLQFSSFSGALAAAANSGIQAGALDLSQTPPMPALFAAYTFSADFDGGAPRGDPWSMGAVEY
jgi:hypothetical protein